MPNSPEITPEVAELLAAIVALGGEAMGSDLVTTCLLTKAQLKRQLNWMENQDLVNQVHSDDGRTWVRATAGGRAALEKAREE